MKNPFPTTAPFACAIFFAPICFVFFSSFAAAQTLVNPGFEQDLNDWAPVSDGGMSAAHHEAAHTGGFGLRVTDGNEKKGSGLESLATEATPGKKYEVSFWAKVVSGQGGIVVSLRFLDEKMRGLMKKSPSVTARPGAGWQKFTLAGTAPENTVALCVRIHSMPVETVTVDLDDFAIRELP